MRRWILLTLIAMGILPLLSLRLVRGQSFEGGVLLTAPIVYVDFEYVGDESGTEEEPFNSIDEALATVEANGTIFVAPGVTHETVPEIAMPVNMQLWIEARQATSVIIGDITSCGPDIDSGSYSNVALAASLALAGDAEVGEGNSHVNLIRAGGSMAGAVWTRSKVLVERGFDVSFWFKPHTVSGSMMSDGVSFVIQNSGPSPTLTTGGNMGYTGIVDSVAIEFDPAQNTVNQDPTSDHVSIQSGGLGQPNSALHNENYTIAMDDAFFSGSLPNQFVHIVYDPREQTLAVNVGETYLVASNFRLENYMNLDEGHAYIGVVSSSGDPSVTSGPNELQTWSAHFPQSCENVLWVQPLNDAWNDTGYPGDTFDHLISGDFLKEGDVIRERLVRVSNDMGLSDQDLQNTENEATGQWRVGFGPGAGGLRRIKRNTNDPDYRNFDHHSVTVPNKPSYKAFFVNGGTAGTVVFLQEMVHIGKVNSQGVLIPGTGTNFVVARHKLTYRLVKIAPEFTEVANPPCVYSDGFIAHVIVEKQEASNPEIWPQANLDTPIIPCWQ